VKTGIERLEPLVFALTLAILPFFVSGCSSADGVAKPSPTNVEIASVFQESSDVKRLAELWESRTQHKPVIDYPIGPGDVLEITVPAMEEIKGLTVRVTAEGTISLPFMGQMQVQGLTDNCGSA
jgi:protein involved in polysaccharide export with SLBB domain